MAVRKVFGKKRKGSFSIYRTCKQKSARHNYLVSEEDHILSFIAAFRVNPVAALSMRWVVKPVKWLG